MVLCSFHLNVSKKVHLIDLCRDNLKELCGTQPFLQCILFLVLIKVINTCL